MRISVLITSRVISNRCTYIGRLPTIWIAVDVPDVESVVLWIQAHDHEEINGVAVNQDDLLKYKEPELSKTALKTALKAGLIVPGATVKTSFNLQIK